jgi:hypothetical protein
MASVGCLFLGSQAAVQRGRRIFESLHKAILARVSFIPPNFSIFLFNIQWDNVYGRTSDEILSMIQAVTIGQTFAMLSGVRLLTYMGFKGSKSLTRMRDILRYLICFMVP